MTLPDLSALGLETSEAERTEFGNGPGYHPAGYPMRLHRDFARLITTLSEARGREASFVDQVCELHRMLSETRAREAAARETIATLTAENAELTRRAADAYRLARQPAPEPVDSGGNDSDRSRHFPMKD